MVDKNGNIISAQDYYPYCGILRSYNTGRNLLNDKYKFTQKERDQETGYDYFGARYYDNELGRFLSVDPHSASYPDLSPYIYCGDNPLLFIDPTGMDSTSSSNATQSILEYCKPIEKGLELVKNGVKIEAKKLVETVKEAGQTILDKGPELLNDVSDGVAYGGLIVGGIALSTGNAEFGEPIIVGSFEVSTEIDAGATGLALTNAVINGGENNWNKFSPQYNRLMSGAAFGNAIEKSISTVSKFVPIFNPLIF